MSLIRRAALKDADRLAGLSSQLGYPVSTTELTRLLKDLELDSDHVVFVLEDGEGQIRGFVHVLVAKRIFLDDFAELGGLVVDQDCRGEGYGKQLLVAAERWSASRGIGEMRVRSNITRTSAREFYLGQGYQDNKKQTVFLKILK
jgi:GNAT superfamily N-acetyltransferase